MLHVKHKRTWSKNLGEKVEMGRLGLSARNQRERTSAKEPRRKNQNDRVLLFPGGKRVRGKLVFVAINLRGGNRVRGGISI